MKKAKKTKPALSQEFQDVRQWYQMESANYSLESVRDALPRILNGTWDESAPEHYLTIVGLVCVYGRPFTNNEPIGRLSEDIVPEEFKVLHKNIMILRHKLFAHADASVAVGKDDYPNEVVIEKDVQATSIAIHRVTVKRTLLEQMVPLVEKLIEKTSYHRVKLARKFSKAVNALGKGQFRLNVMDPNSPTFFKLSQDEKDIREKRKSEFDFTTKL